MGLGAHQHAMCWPSRPEGIYSGVTVEYEVEAPASHRAAIQHAAVQVSRCRLLFFCMYTTRGGPISQPNRV